MTNLLEQAINCDDGDKAAKIIQHALDIESDDVVNHCNAAWQPKTVCAKITVAHGSRVFSFF